MDGEQRTISVLKFFAWLNLLGGVIGAVIIFFNWGFVEVKRGTYYTFTEKIFNPLPMGISIGLLVEGIFGCALLLVICSIANNLIKIRKNTGPLEDEEILLSETNINQEDNGLRGAI